MADVGGAPLRSAFSSPRIAHQLNEANLQSLTLQGGWTLFMRSKLDLFGPQGQPIVSVILAVNVDDGSYFVTVFMRPVRHGQLEDVQSFENLLTEVFSPYQKPCPGQNSSQDIFSTRKLGGQNCAIFLSENDGESCVTCSSDFLSGVKKDVVDDEEPMDCLEGETLQVFDQVKIEPLQIETKYAKEEDNPVPKQCYQVLEEYAKMNECKTCTLCANPSKFDDVKLFRRHVYREHKVKMFKCVHCEHESFTIDGVSKHSKKTHGYGTFVCVVCNEHRKRNVVTAVWVSEIVAHMQRFHSEDGQTFLVHCPSCKKDISVLNNSNSHSYMDGHLKNCIKERIKKETDAQARRSVKAFLEGKKGYECDTCGEKFRFRERLSNHVIRKHTKAYPYLCDECPFKTVNRNALEKHQEVHEFYRQKALGCEMTLGVVCELCGQTFPNDHQLNRHSNIAHFEIMLEKKGGCQPCMLGFETEQTLIEHLTEMHPYVDMKWTKCLKCNLLHSTSQKLEKLHLFHCQRETTVTSSGRKMKNKKNQDSHKLPKRCNICDINLPNAFALTRHNSIEHSNDPRNRCDICGFRGTSQAVATHMSKHMEPKHTCDICGKKFKLVVDLHDHIAMHKGEKNHKCSNCEMAYSSRKSLTTHKHTKHKDIFGPYKKRLKS